MKARLARQVAGAVAVTLLATGCSGGGDDGSDDESGTTDAPREATPADTTGPIKDAALAAGSVAVARTVRPGAADGRVTHEEIEVELTEPPSGRVLHVGEEIWTLTVADGVGYLKDQSERKSTNRWQRLSAAETTTRLEDVTLDGLLGIIDQASRITRTEKATVSGSAATCHTMTLAPRAATRATTGATTGAEAGPVPQSARICVDGDRRPLELVVTADDVVTTSTFTSWGLAVEALAPPASLVDGD